MNTIDPSTYIPILAMTMMMMMMMMLSAEAPPRKMQVRWSSHCSLQLMSNGGHEIT
jgi:hypothetical protein